MDRRHCSWLAACGLGVLLAVTGGCRTPRSEVPPGRQFLSDGRQAPAVGFSSDPHPPAITGMPSTSPGAQSSTTGVMANRSTNLGAPTNNVYGPSTTASAIPQLANPAGAYGPTGAPTASYPSADPATSPASLGASTTTSPSASSLPPTSTGPATGSLSPR